MLRSFLPDTHHGPSGAKTAPDARVRAPGPTRALPVLEDVFQVGYYSAIMNNQERMQRESKLITTIREQLPDFVNACAGDEAVVLIHQDAFAGEYQEEEYALLGKAIKYAGLKGKEIRVIGINRSTLREVESVH